MAYCHGFLKPSHIKCSKCIELENILMDNPVHDENKFFYNNKKYKLIVSPGNLNDDPLNYKSTVFHLNPLVLKLKVAEVMKNECDILLGFECNNNTIIVREEFNPIELTCDEILIKLIKFYKSNKHFFLQGSPDVSTIGIDQDKNLVIKIGDFSSITFHNKRHIFGLPSIVGHPFEDVDENYFNVKHSWAYRRLPYCDKSATLELYCYIVSLNMSNLRRSSDWNKLMTKIFPQDFFKGMKNDFLSFYPSLVKILFHKKLIDLIENMIN